MDKSKKLDKQFKEGIKDLSEVSDYIANILSKIIYFFSKYSIFGLFVCGASFVYILIKFYYWIEKKFEKN